MEPEKSKPASSREGSSDKPTNERSVDKTVSKNTDVIKSPLATNLFGKDSNKVSKLIFRFRSVKFIALNLKPQTFDFEFKNFLRQKIYTRHVTTLFRHFQVIIL